MSATDHVAAADCETCRPGAIAQPANTVSSLSLSIAGLALVARAGHAPGPDRPVREPTAESALGWAAVAAGLGSVAYHGPGTRPGRFLHDATLIMLCGAVVVADVTRVTGRPPHRALFAALPGLAAAAAASRWSLPAQIVAGTGAAAAEIVRVRSSRDRRGRGRRPIAEFLVAVGGALGHVFGRTGGPLCRPDSIWQAHAAWHTAMAVVLVLRD